MGATHAVSHRPHLPIAGHRVLTVEEPDEGPRVRHIGLGAQRAHQGKDLVARRFVPKRGALRQDRRLHGAVIGIDDQHCVPRLGQPPPHLLEGGPQAERIGPDQHAWMDAARGVHEVTVRRAVGCQHLDIPDRHPQRVRGPRQEHGQPRPDRQRRELAPGQDFRMAQVVLRVTECSLVAHECLPSHHDSRFSLTLFALQHGSRGRISARRSGGCRDAVTARTESRSSHDRARPRCSRPATYTNGNYIDGMTFRPWIPRQDVKTLN